MEYLKIISSYYSYGLAIGLITRNEIINWVDTLIEKYDVPYELIEISLSKDKSINEILSLFKSIHENMHFNESVPIILDVIRTKYENREITEEELIEYLSRLHTESATAEGNTDLITQLDYFSDEYYLASQGIYGDTESVIENILNELLNYKGYKDILRD